MPQYDPSATLAAIDQIAPEIAKLGPRPSWRDPDQALHWRRKSEGLIGPLKVALEGTSPLGEWHNAMINTGTGSTGVQPIFLAPKLAELIADKGPEFTKEAFVKLLTVEETTAHSCALVWGFDAKDEVDFGDGLTVRMLDQDVADRRYREWQAVPWHVRLEQRPALFTVPFKIRPVLHRADEQSDTLKHQEGSAARTKIREEILALSTLGPAPATFEEGWSELVDPHLSALASDGKYSSLLEIVPSRMVPPTRLDKASSALLHQFRGLAPKLRERLLTIIDRLESAKRRSSPTNQALDACIAIEMILSGKGDPQGAITYRLALRGALFLGATLAERQSLRKAITDAYQLRSRAAHGSSSAGDANAQPTASKAIEICNRLIRGQISRGTPVDWGLLELNPPPLIEMAPP